MEDCKFIDVVLICYLDDCFCLSKWYTIFKNTIFLFIFFFLNKQINFSKCSYCSWIWRDPNLAKLLVCVNQIQ